MWQHLVVTALDKGMHVSLYDSNDQVHAPIENVEDLNKYKIWGTSSWYQRRILTISV